jgi:hypothetical protein
VLFCFGIFSKIFKTGKSSFDAGKKVGFFDAE